MGVNFHKNSRRVLVDTLKVSASMKGKNRNVYKAVNY